MKYVTRLYGSKVCVELWNRSHSISPVQSSISVAGRYMGSNRPSPREFHPTDVASDEGRSPACPAVVGCPAVKIFVCR